MINNISFLNVVSLENEKISYKCPSCGIECNEKSSNCDGCGYNLEEYKNIILSRYIYFNEAIAKTNSKDYFNALLSITKFLTFEPNHEIGNGLYIYLLYKNKRKVEYDLELEKFENKFKYSSFIKDIEQNGIDNYIIPPKYEITIPFNNNAFNDLMNLYTGYRYKTILDISELGNGFFELIQFYSGRKDFKKLSDFYDKRFLQFISKYEISFNSMNGKKYDKLLEEEKNKIELIGYVTKSNKPDGTIITVTPSIFIRSKLISKEKAMIVKKNKR